MLLSNLGFFAYFIFRLGKSSRHWYILSLLLELVKLLPLMSRPFYYSRCRQLREIRPSNPQTTGSLQDLADVCSNVLSCLCSSYICLVISFLIPWGILWYSQFIRCNSARKLVICVHMLPCELSLVDFKSGSVWDTSWGTQLCLFYISQVPIFQLKGLSGWRETQDRLEAGDAYSFSFFFFIQQPCSRCMEYLKTPTRPWSVWVRCNLSELVWVAREMGF